MSLKEKYRNLFSHEIETLKLNGCHCEDWKRVRVKDGFDPDCCKNVVFSGEVFLGVFNETYTEESGISIPAGISNARIHNCTIGSDVIINNIGNSIANYFIDDNAVIINCGTIQTAGITSFGNGTEVAVVNEAGGRVIKIWDRMSAHEAYIASLYRHRMPVVNNIEKLVDEYAASVASSTGQIGFKSRICNAGTIRNVKIGPYTSIEGSLLLNEGSVNSCRESPVFIGQGVIMEHFIVCSGAQVVDSAIVKNCFVGQGTILGRNFSAESSLFFANCEGLNGEACSLFAGPYTVSHHKSTLLIAGVFSFMNAGSGSNMSNHMYKLGPVHQGILERGSKTASNSYIMWPSHIGPFTLVIGSHRKNINSSSLPFSYLIGTKDESTIVPGMTLINAGTIRDAGKWPLRDRRKESLLIDQLNFNMLNPFTVGKMIQGRDLLRELLMDAPEGTSSFTVHNMKISRAVLKRGIDLYQAGINKFLSDSLIARLQSSELLTISDLERQLTSGSLYGNGYWVDLAGLVAPVNRINVLLNDIESGKVNSAGELSESFVTIHKMYDDFLWRWVCEEIEQENEIAVNKITINIIIAIIEKGKKGIKDLYNLILEDAEKEFSLLAMTGYGVFGGEEAKVQDFKEVRGNLQDNKFVSELKDQTEQKISAADQLIDRLRSLAKN